MLDNDNKQQDSVKHDLNEEMISFIRWVLKKYIHFTLR